MKNVFIMLSLFLTVYNIGVQLDSRNYDDNVLNSEDAWLIKYYSELCLNCIEFEPVWKSAIEKIKRLKLGKVKIDSDEGMKLAEKFNLLQEGIPCVVLVYGKKGEQVVVMSGLEPFKSEKELLISITANVRKYLKKTDQIYKREEL